MAILFTSTRAPANGVGFSAALQQGLAPDGGLYVPTRWPATAAAALAPQADLAARGASLLAPFLAGDPLEAELPAITGEAFNFAAPLVTLDAPAKLSLLELFHGPTAAFKDFGARFLASALARLPRTSGRNLNMLVATSGDTGGAVAAAFHERPGMQVTVLFPKGLVSPTQEQQLTCWGGNVASLAVRGTFDDCQRLVKEALQAPDLRARFASLLGQQHQSWTTSAADGLLRRGERGAASRAWAARRIRHTERQPGECSGLHLGAQAWAADRRHCARA